MHRSESIKELAAALPKAQAAMKGAVKDAQNPHFRSKYADLTSVIEAVKPALNANGITFLQPVTFNEHGVCVETLLLHTSGEWISESLTIPVSKHDAQGVGSAISYGRRYGLQAICGVPAEDDDGNAATATAPLSIAEKQRADWLASIEEQTDPEALAGLWKAISKACRDAQDVGAHNAMKAAVAAKGAKLKKSA